jgi:hypothetical protein
MRAAVIALLFVAASGCGGADEFAAARDRVREYVPSATAVRCSGTPRRAVDCEGRVGRVEVHCEFRYRRANAAYSGSEACWSDKPF